ncbi:ABC transporter ATP-binding protein [uncultured Microbacterium sp.]|uniref:ABC transporter ATP-binding protein n=1 Tax=uncultured Microbacterium sp. TaxID=191216 RepID=UPI002621D3F4|nr:ABC transporter ATP-binding protein [uncultured Microbacterium sp.]
MIRVLAKLRELMPYLPADARNYLIRYVIVSCLLAVLDVAALMLLAITLPAMTTQQPIALPLIGRITQDAFIWVIVAVAALILLKSALSVLQQWFATRRLAQFELEIGRQLFDSYIKAPWTLRITRNTAHVVRIADVGIANSITGFVLPIIQFPSMAVTFVLILGVIFVAQPLTAIITVVYLGVIMAVLYFIISRRVVQAGRVALTYSLRVAALMTEMMLALKEITLRDKTGEIAGVVHHNRSFSTRARANMNFLGSLPGFVLNAALVGGFLLVGGIGMAFGSMETALASVALFAVAGFRLVPSLTGFQGIVTATTANLPHVEGVIEDIQASRVYMDQQEQLGQEPLADEPRHLRLESLSFTYPGASEPSVRDIDLTIPMGSTLALVGASGAGKSTLVDIILGLLTPQQGGMHLDDQSVIDVMAAWRARVGYVPQEVALFDGTISQNVALSWDEDAIDYDLVKRSLASAQMLETVMAREGGLRAPIGERGIALSGGQRQRLGIARALYTDPLVLVLDEATSALDTKTEALVSKALKDLKGRVTTISVAHRLSTIRDSDMVCFMQDGTIAARGTFDELVETVPNFAEQAQLAGLA